MKQTNEIWKAVPGYGGFYLASNLGRIKVTERTIKKRYRGRIIEQLYEGKTLLASERRGGYRYVHLSVDKQAYVVAVHKMVLLAFVGESPSGYEACHNDGNPKNNEASNLRWDTHANNNRDKAKHGTYLRGERHPLVKLTLDNVIEIRRSSLPGVALSKKFNVRPCTISAIRTGRTWNQTHKIYEDIGVAHVV